MSGAGATNDYRLSANFLDQKGIIDANSVRRIGLGANYTQRLANDRLKLRFNLRGSQNGHRFTPLGVLSNAAQFGPTQPILDPTTPTGFYDWPGPTLTSTDNPVAILNLAEEKARTNRAVGNMQTEYSLPWINGLRASVNLGFDVPRPTVRTSPEHPAPAIVGAPGGGRQTRFRPKQVSQVLETYLNYTTPRPVGPGTLDLTGGYSWSKNHADSSYYEATGLPTDAWATMALSRRRTSRTSGSSRRASWFPSSGGPITTSTITTSLPSAYVVTALAFGAGHDFGTFPSVAPRLAPVARSRSCRGVKGLSDLKLRASWAKTGNQSFGNYLGYTSYQLGDGQTQYQFGDTVFTTSRPSAVDPNIKWEETRAFNLGLDFGFANQRFSGAIDWYRKLTDDLIFTVPVAGFSNLSNFVTTNIGSMRNSGVELSLRTRLLDGGQGLSWKANFTAARNHNNLPQHHPVGGHALKILVGEWRALWTKIQVLYAWPTGQHVLRLRAHPGRGKPIYATERQTGWNGRRTAPSTTRTCMWIRTTTGSSTRRTSGRSTIRRRSGSWATRPISSYGNWDLGFTSALYLGNYAYNNVASGRGLYRADPDSPYNLHSSVLATEFQTPQFQSDYYVEDASFLRMDNLTLGYTFDFRGQSARLFGTVQNAFTITGYSGVDPTANTSERRHLVVNGIDSNIYPRSRTFSAGLSLRF